MRARLAALLRDRKQVAGALVLCGIAALFWHPPSWRLVAGSAVALLFAYPLFRNPRLTLLVAIAPLPALLWFAHPGAAQMLGFSAALLMAADVGSAVLENEARDGAIARCWSIAPVLAGALALEAFAALPHGWAAFAAAALVLGVVLLAMPVGMRFLAFGESFYIGANRATEARASWLETAEQLGQPRWVFSLTGVLLVLAVLAFSGARGIAPWQWGGPVLAGLVLWLVTRDSRATAACVVVAAVMLTPARDSGALPVFMLLVLYLVQDAALSENWLRARRDRMAPMVLAGLGAAVLAMVWNGVAAGLVMLAALAAALVFFPALYLALHRLAPVRRDLAEIYR